MLCYRLADAAIDVYAMMCVLSRYAPSNYHAKLNTLHMFVDNFSSNISKIYLNLRTILILDDCLIIDETATISKDSR